jgi:hypothetical protein
MDEAGVVKQTTTEQVIQTHQLSRTQSTEAAKPPKGMPMADSYGSTVTSALFGF